MARNKTVLQNQFPYHITARCINREWFNLPMEKVWQICCEELYMTHLIHNLQIHSFILMDNHYHLIVTTPESNLSECMRRFSTRTSFRITRMCNRINQTFAGRYFKTILAQPNHFLNAYKYNYRNPVETNLCRLVQDYPYSTLRAKLGGSKLLVPILNDDYLFSNPEICLNWLNKKPSLEKLQAVQIGLRKTYFSAAKNKNRKKILKDDELL